MTHLTAGPLYASVKVSGVSSGTPVQVATVFPVLTLSTVNLAAKKTTLLIHGFGFSTTPGNNSVIFSGGATGTVTAATATQLTVTGISGLLAGPLDAYLICYDGSNGIDISAKVQVAKVIPVVTVNTAKPLPVGTTSLTIDGFGFDPISSNNVVTVDGVIVTVNYASATQLMVTVNGCIRLPSTAQ